MRWSDSLATGVRRIDDQHRLIFTMVGDFRSALDVGQGGRTYDLLLDFLERYIGAHFEFEEQCMEEYKCPVARENRAAHAEFTGVLGDFRKRYAANGYCAEEARELIDTLDSWFSRHIARVDARLKEYVGK